MQRLHKKNKITFPKGWIPIANIVENTRRGRIGSTSCHLYHYAGNNPVRYIDPDGWETESNTLIRSNISMNFNKTEQLLTVNTSFGYMKFQPFTIKLTNNVRTPEQRGFVPVKFKNYYYFPEDFPNGTWNIIEAGFNDRNSDIGLYIRTNAGRLVDTYEQNEEGNWVKSSNQEYDTGYLFHGSDGDGNITGDNNEDYSTWGCGRGKNIDILRLVIIILYAKTSGGDITVKVED